MMSSKSKGVSLKQNNKNSPVTISRTVSAEYSGPLPLPQHLEQYEKVLPGAAERIMKMAENQQEHRMKAENSVLETYNKARIRGLTFAFVIFCACLLLAGIALYLNQTGFAVASMIVGIVGASISFITGKPKKENHKNENQSDQ